MCFLHIPLAYLCMCVTPDTYLHRHICHGALWGRLSQGSVIDEHLNPHACKQPFIWQKGLCEVIKLRILGRGDCSAWSGWVQCHRKDPRKEAEEEKAAEAVLEVEEASLSWECRWPSEIKTRKRTVLQSWQKEHSFLVRGLVEYDPSWIYDFQNCKRIYRCLYKLLNRWQFVLLGIENPNTSFHLLPPKKTKPTDATVNTLKTMLLEEMFALC